MMERQLTVILMLCVLLFFTTEVPAQQNPFFSKQKGAPEAPSIRKAPPHPAFIKLAIWQKQLRENMADRIDRAQEEKRLGPVIYLMLLAFFYGVLHAAGPGHGKAVATSFIITQKSSLSRGLLLGNGVALAHGLSGIALILTGHFVLKSGIIGPLEHTTRAAQYISYSLITLLGIVLVVKSLVEVSKFYKSSNAAVENEKTIHGFRVLPVAIAVGLIPCPGVIMVMLLAMSMNMIMLGVILGLSITAGMALTITLVVLMFMYTKKMLVKSVSHRPKWALRAALVIELCAGILLTVLGGMMLIGMKYS